MEKLCDRIDWHNNTTPAINETNLNKMSKALDDLDDRVILIAGDILVTVPELQEMLEDCTELEQRLEAMTENPPYIGENGHWYIWDTDTGAYVDSGIDASITVEIADITMLAPNATPYVTNTGTDTDPIFHLFIPRGQPGKGISSIAKTGTSGYVDTYTITYTDNTSTTYTVTNGRNTDQASTIPTASASLVDTIYQYIGESTSSYTHGFYYECVNDGGIYKWVNIPVGNDPVEVSNSDPYTYRKSLGNLADMEIVGASVGWNQLVQNGNFASTSNWQSTSASLTVANNEATITLTGNAWNNDLKQSSSIVANHVYMMIAKVKASSGVTKLGFYLDAYRMGEYINVSQSYQTFFRLRKSDASGSYFRIELGENGSSLSGQTYNVKEYNLFDLTLLFGSTIADAIYSMEQAQAGAGVAFFRKYFPKDYYAYDAGSVQSVCVGSRKVVGKNLLNHKDYATTESYNTITDLGIQFYRSGQTVNTIYIRKKPNGGSAENIASRSSNGRLTGSIIQDGTIVTISIRCVFANGDTNISYDVSKLPKGTYNFSIMCNGIGSATGVVTEIQLEIGTTATAYEPYTETTYPFDSTKQLRGMFSLVGGELKANGDVWRGNKIQRNWAILSNQTGAIGDTITLTGLKTNGNIICSAGLISEVGTISGTTLTLTKAISGADFVYEKATPTTEAAQPYQNPQRAYIDGTEEFIDGLTRDVMIPVGNNSVYQQDKVLPSIEDYVDAIAEQKADISAIATNEDKATASQAYTVGQHFYKDGKFCTVIANIASGGTFTLNTNYSESDIATIIASLEARITELES